MPRRAARQIVAAAFGAPQAAVLLLAAANVPLAPSSDEDAAELVLARHANAARDEMEAIRADLDALAAASGRSTASAVRLAQLAGRPGPGPDAR